MELRTIFLVIHAASAVLGVGQVFTLALIAKPAATSHEALAMLMRLIRVASWGLLLMLLSGIGLLYASNWELLQTAWLKIGFVLYVAVGALMGIAQGRVRKALADSARAPTAARWVSSLAWISSALILGIVVLMVAKPD